MKWIKINGHYIEPENIEEIRDAYEKGYEIPEPVYRRKINLYEEFNKIWLKEVFKVLKPGGYLLAFSGTRTYHRLGSAVEDVGFEIKDMIEWMYGTGFPKSYNISKGFDKQAGVEREVVGKSDRNDRKLYSGQGGHHGNIQDKYKEKGRESVNLDITKPSTDKAKEWEGWGTALKPAHEPILLAQKPREGTYCNNIDEYGVGGINIDDCRVNVNPEVDDIGKTTNRNKRKSETWEEGSGFKNEENELAGVKPEGRFPANLILSHHPDCEYKGEKKVKGQSGGTGNHDGNVYGERTNQGEEVKDYVDENGMEIVSDWDCHPSCPVRTMNEQSGVSEGKRSVRRNRSGMGIHDSEKGTFGKGDVIGGYNDKGGAARYFNQFHFIDEDFFKYTAKASKKERTCDGEVENDHPTVKPLELMKWLVRLVTPKDGLVLDPFCGSGTTCIACIKEGMNYIGMDIEEHNCEIAKNRINYFREEKDE